MIFNVWSHVIFKWQQRSVVVELDCLSPKTSH